MVDETSSPDKPETIPATTPSADTDVSSKNVDKRLPRDAPSVPEKGDPTKARNDATKARNDATKARQERKTASGVRVRTF